MNEHDSTTEQGINEKAKQVKEKVAPAAEQVKATVTDLRDRANTPETVLLLKANAVQIVTCVAVVGILINNKRSFKFTKKIVKNMDKNMLEAQNTIKALKAAGQTFEFYPGVGVWVE